MRNRLIIALTVAALAGGCLLEGGEPGGETGFRCPGGRCDSHDGPSQSPADLDDAFGRCEDAFARRNHEDVLRFEPPEAFEFCPDARGLNLTNLSWLAFLAGNEYAHAGYLLPVLGELGFGAQLYHEWDLEGEEWTGPEADFLAGCYESIYWTRCIQELVEADDLWSAAADWPPLCAQRWHRDVGEQPAALAASFEHWLVQNDHSDWSIQFFSGGEFEMGLRHFEEGSTQMMWAEHGTLPLVVLSFRGTEPDSWDDVLADLVFFQDDFAGWGEAHQGFLRAFSTVYDHRIHDHSPAECDDPTHDHRIEARLQYLADFMPQARIWVTGHSLGGALATLMTASILERMERDPSWRSLNLRGLVTFGSPRVGDADFVEAFNTAARERGVTVLRVVNGDDTVTNIPKDWPWIGLGYDHVGDTVYLGGENDPDCCPADDPDCCVEDEAGAERCPGPCLVYTPSTRPEIEDVIGSFDDHSMSTYYERIRAQLENEELLPYVGCGAAER